MKLANRSMSQCGPILIIDMNLIINPDGTQQMKRTPILHAKSIQNLMKQQSLHRVTHSYPSTPSDRPTSNFINYDGIISVHRLILIALLMFASISRVVLMPKAHWSHAKSLLFYFNYYSLGNTNLGIYDSGDNIDECVSKLILFNQMREHFDRLVTLSSNFHVDSFAELIVQDDRNVHMDLYMTNQSYVKKVMTMQEFAQLFNKVDLKEFLISLQLMEIRINFGDNQKVRNFTVIHQYKVFNGSMLNIDLSVDYQPSQQQQHGKAVVKLRVLEQIIAMFLLISYFLAARAFYDDAQVSRKLRKNSLYWCGSLIFLNLAVLTSSELAPTCSILQLLPVFENYDISNSLTYNFNVNLRYALPIVFGVILPVYCVMNGFIFYSMLVYQSDYFEDYMNSFCSYFYNMYQYGTYEIFTQIKYEGNLAYFLYFVLYFYMVLVGNNLLPALFCTLIFKRISERGLLRFVEAKIKMLVCPKCQQENYQHETDGFEIKIRSPKSPYLKSGTTLSKKPQNVKVAKMFIDDDCNNGNRIDLLRNKNQRIKELIGQLRIMINSCKAVSDRGWLEDRLNKIYAVQQQLHFK